MIGGVWRHEVLGGVMVGEHEGDGDDFGEGMGAEGRRELCGLNA